MLETLLDANQAITQDLPTGFIKKQHWRQAGWAVFKAADTGRSEDISAATELLVQAVEAEGWWSGIYNHGRVHAARNTS